MERIVYKAKSHKEAGEWDILQQINMKPEERQRIAKELKKKVYGTHTKDIRKASNTGR